MANRPANAGAHSAGPQRGPATAPPPVRQDAPPPVHHQGFPRSQTTAAQPGTTSAQPGTTPARPADAARPRTTPARRRTAPARRRTAPARRRTAPARRRTAPARAADADRPAAGVLAWLPYLIVLAGVAVGLSVAGQGSRHTGRGAAVVGGALVAAAVARLLLPPRYAGLLASRGKALDVAAFAVLGAAVLGAALSLP
jgi:Protein of unknown function (DUF3017)